MPRFEPGAHIDVHLADGLTRSYSLVNDASERHRYVLGIKREKDSRGGSVWLHEHARVGATLSIEGPRNHFALNEAASHSLLIAGGIGVTPLWSMVQRLQSLGRSWELHYRVRARRSAPLLDELSAPTVAEHVHLGFSEDSGGKRLDLLQVVRAAPSGTHFYCCGPIGMIDAFEQVCSHLDPSVVHFEYFGAKDAPATAGGFTVELDKSGCSIPIVPGKTILGALREAGVEVPSSCQQGVCGACETRVLKGVPDHRDLVLTDAEKASGSTMMICCSGSLTETLVLDL